MGENISTPWVIQLKQNGYLALLPVNTLAKIISEMSPNPLGYRVRTLSAPKTSKSKQKLALSLAGTVRKCRSGP